MRTERLMLQVHENIPCTNGAPPSTRELIKSEPVGFP
jgi:hypothetical protein